jgi:hypothetical protein
MGTCDDEFVAAAKDFIKRQHDAGKLFFVWLNTTHLHVRTHTKPLSLGQAGPHSGWCRHQRDRAAPRLAADVLRDCRRCRHSEKLLNGHKAGDKTFKVHIDGYNLLPFLTVKGDRSFPPRQGAASFTIDQAMEKMTAVFTSGQ